MPADWLNRRKSPKVRKIKKIRKERKECGPGWGWTQKTNSEWQSLQRKGGKYKIK